VLVLPVIRVMVPLSPTAKSWPSTSTASRNAALPGRACGVQIRPAAVDEAMSPRSPSATSLPPVITVFVNLSAAMPWGAPETPPLTAAQ